MQQEIEFFWPLTQQISLDLDCSNCAAPKYTAPNMITSTGIFTFAPTSTIASTYNINVDTVKFTLNKKPNIIRKLAYNILGIKWGIN